MTNNAKYEIGKFYNIPCAKIVDLYGNVQYYVPIIGEPHTDKQFGIEYTHYHIDGRFITSSYNLYSVDENGKTNGIIYFGYPKEQQVGMYAKEIVIKRKQCRRLTTGIKPPIYAKKYWDWYNSMQGKSCKGKKCPHLGTEMIEHTDGNLICPLHNLIGCKTKEIIINPK